MIEGPGPNFLAKNILQTIQPFIMDADSHTNTRQFRAWQGAYNLLGIPLSAAAMTGLNTVLGSVPYIGPAARVATAYGLQKLTSPGVSADVAEAATGPKGVKDPAFDTSGGSGLPTIPKLGGLPSLPKLGAAGRRRGHRGWGRHERLGLDRRCSDAGLAQGRPPSQHGAGAGQDRRGGGCGRVWALQGLRSRGAVPRPAGARKTGAISLCLFRGVQIVHL